jgi:hypothetical protein
VTDLTAGCSSHVPYIADLTDSCRCLDEGCNADSIRRPNIQMVGSRLRCGIMLQRLNSEETLNYIPIVSFTISSSVARALILIAFYSGTPFDTRYKMLSCQNRLYLGTEEVLITPYNPNYLPRIQAKCCLKSV